MSSNKNPNSSTPLDPIFDLFYALIVVISFPVLAKPP